MIKSGFVAILLIALFSYLFVIQKIKKESKHQNQNQTKEQKSKDLKLSLEYINSTEYLKSYIIDVINSGSRGLNFKGGIMEGGFASKEDAPKIACYVMSLSGRECKEPYSKDASMFYSSICAGCHGMDGKGIHGTYPDLTRPKLLGIKKKEEELLKQIKR